MTKHRNILAEGGTVQDLLTYNRELYGNTRMRVNTDGGGGEGIENNGNGGQGPETPLVTPPAANEGGGSDVPYAEYLAKLPESVRPLVDPIFKEWDGNVTKKFQEIHGTYEPWKPVTELGYQPQAVQQALMFAQALEQNPAAVISQLVEAYPDVREQLIKAAAATPPAAGGGNGTTELDPDDPYAPHFARLDQLQKGFDTLAQLFLADRQSKEQEAQNAALTNVLDKLHKDHGAFDDGYVVSLIAQGKKPEEAVAQFKQVVQQHAAQLNAPNLNAPVVLGQGGGVPSGTIDPATLGPKETKDLVAAVLEAAAKQN